jgi:hypothetical protein
MDRFFSKPKSELTAIQSRQVEGMEGFDRLQNTNNFAFVKNFF